MILKWSTPIYLVRDLYFLIVWGLTGWGIMAPGVVIAYRKLECSKCPHNSKTSYPQCRVCTCFIEVKTMLASDECPDNPPRWNRIKLSKKPT